VQRGAGGAEHESTFDASDALVAVALLSVGAGVIHAAVIREHLEEWWLYGTFFAVVAVGQLIWAALALRRPTRSLLIWGALGNSAFVLLWLVTRITGLPVGPEPWTPESVGLVDVAASVFEVVLVISAVLMLRRNTLPERTTVRLDRPQLAVFMGAVAAITWIAATGGGHH
jgi:hypothetical protein